MKLKVRMASSVADLRTRRLLALGGWNVLRLLRPHR